MPELIAAAQVAAQPWRNGGGVTRELFTAPAGADWRLRISLADIERDGPFSPFPGVRRHFAVLSGAGVALRFGEGPWQTQRASDPPLAFDGAAAPDCRLLDGPTRDLNLMLRDGLEGGMALQPDPRWTWRAVFDPASMTLQIALQAWPAPRPGLLYLGTVSA